MNHDHDDTTYGGPGNPAQSPEARRDAAARRWQILWKAQDRTGALSVASLQEKEAGEQSIAGETARYMARAQARRKAHPYRGQYLWNDRYAHPAR